MLIRWAGDINLGNQVKKVINELREAKVVWVERNEGVKVTTKKQVA